MAGYHIAAAASRRKMARSGVLAGALVLALVPPALGWFPGGHGILSRAAVRGLPEDVPAFFRSGEGAVAHYSHDPDVAKNRGTPILRDAERPEHYLDLELLQGRELPRDRFAFVRLCAEIGVRPEKVGFLPYAVAEWTERLTVAFAEHRKWPENPFIQDKCLVYAGHLCHYAEDLCQPLHLTVHFDGRARPDGSSPRSGIHAKVDGLVQLLSLDPGDLASGPAVGPLEDLVAGVLGMVDSSYALVDRVYELEHLLPVPGKTAPPPAAEVVLFAGERARVAARFTSALFLTAWRRSETVRLPGWLNRAAADEDALSPR